MSRPPRRGPHHRGLKSPRRHAPTIRHPPPSWRSFSLFFSAPNSLLFVCYGGVGMEKFVDPRYQGRSRKPLKPCCILRAHRGRFVAETRDSLYLGDCSNQPVAFDLRAVHRPTPLRIKLVAVVQIDRVCFSSIELHADSFGDERRPCRTFDLDGAFRGDAHAPLDRFDGFDLLAKPDA